MPTYEWINDDGDIEETEVYNEPPALEGNWRRYYGSISIGSVPGAGGSPFKPPVSRSKKTSR